MPKRLPEEKRQAILEAIEAGAGNRARADIAREFKVSAATVGRIADEAGLDEVWVRTNTLNATRARSIDLADGRTRLQERWLAKANEGLDRSEKACTVYGFGGPFNEFNSHELDLPPAGDYRSFVTAAAVATDKMLALAKHDAGGSGVDEAKGLILGMAEGLRSIVDGIDETQP